MLGRIVKSKFLGHLVMLPGFDTCRSWSSDRELLEAMLTFPLWSLSLQKSGGNGGSPDLGRHGILAGAVNKHSKSVSLKDWILPSINAANPLGEAG